MRDIKNEEVSLGFKVDVKKYKYQAETQKALKQEYESELSNELLNSLWDEFRCWIDSGDTDYLDAAVSLLHSKEVSIKGVLLDEVGKLAKARLSREVKRSTGTTRKKREKKRYLQATEKFQKLPYEIANDIAFTLIEICGLKTEKAYFYTSRILERDHKRVFHHFDTCLTVSVKQTLSDRTIRRNYEKLKQANLSEYSLKKQNLQLWQSMRYPDMTPEEIQQALLKDLKYDEF